MKPWITTTLIIALAMAHAGDVFGQRPQQRRPGQSGASRAPGGGGPGGGGPGSAGSSTLERSGLKVGQQMPDVTIYDENGEKFSLSRVKGKHAVLVFGCLT
jgi:hypothetical protein